MCVNALAKAGVNVRVIDQRSILQRLSVDIFSKLPGRPSKVAAGQADGIQVNSLRQNSTFIEEMRDLAAHH